MLLRAIYARFHDNIFCNLLQFLFLLNCTHLNSLLQYMKMRETPYRFPLLLNQSAILLMPLGLIALQLQQLCRASRCLLPLCTAESLLLCCACSACSYCLFLISSYNACRSAPGYGIFCRLVISGFAFSLPVFHLLHSALFSVRCIISPVVCSQPFPVSSPVFPGIFPPGFLCLFIHRYKSPAFTIKSLICWNSILSRNFIRAKDSFVYQGARMRFKGLQDKHRYFIPWIHASPVYRKSEPDTLCYDSASCLSSLLYL